MSDIDVMSVNAIRALAADTVQKANSGHPGLPLGAAPMAYELWANFMKHNPKNPNWADRDRFILSGGHGSSLLYSLLHIFGYGDLSMEDMKNFRQWGSLTPGHPEYGHTVGVEATTGPLGAGMAMAVGMAMAEAHLASRFNKEGYPVVDHYTYVLGGDGCMMEGISYEAFSLAGTLKLSKLIVLYDSNKISIEGDTDIAFQEDVKKRFESFGFQTLVVEDGNNLEEIAKAIAEAKADTTRPTMITVRTKIGHGCPAKEGTASAHGEPLGVDNVRALKENLGFDPEKEFYVPQEVYDNAAKIVEKNQAAEDAWNTMFQEYREKFPEMAKLWDDMHNPEAAKALADEEAYWAIDDKADATRNISGKMINRIKEYLPGFIGGSADLAPSNKTNMSEMGDYSAQNYSGRNLHFGVRELAMAAIGNGMTLHGGLRPYVSTFFVFSDYVKPMARLSSLMGTPLTYVFTHDSIGVGEDGPTHEPIEQLAMLRSMPNFTVYRPADMMETAVAWYYAVTSQKTPTALVLTRQNLPQLAGTSKEALKGGYIVDDSEKAVPELIIMASGSEVQLAIEAKETLKQEGVDVRVVSMPSMDVFEQQSEAYKEQVLPKACRKRVAVEALSSFGWGKYVGLDGGYVTMDTFGASAPANVLFQQFGITTAHVLEVAKEVLAK